MKIKVRWNTPLEPKGKQPELPKVVDLPKDIFKQYWETGDTKVIPNYLSETFGMPVGAWYPIQEKAK